MIADLGLIIVIGVTSWIALDAVALREHVGFGRLSALGVAVIAWCSGELLLHHAADAEAALWARRLLYAGLCAFGPLWLWTAAGIRGPVWARPAVRLVLSVFALAEVVVYSSLYWSPALLVSGSGLAPVHGPLFILHAVVQWSAIMLSIGVMVGTIWRLPNTTRMAPILLLVGLLAPLLGNWLYIALGSSFGDPTPILVGSGAVAIRFYLLDLVGTSAVNMVAHAELFDQVDVGIFVASMDGEILSTNACARRLLADENPRGQDKDSVVSPFVRDPGFDVRHFPIHRRGVEIGSGCVVADRRSARALERRVEIGSRVEALGFLSLGLAHEINNPLNLVLGNASLLAPIFDELQEGAEAPRHQKVARDGREIVERIEEGAERIADVVERMAYLSEPEAAGEPTRTPVLPLVRKAIGLAGLGGAVDRIQTEGLDPSLDTTARPEDVTQILLHLLRNALEASSAEQAVLIRVEETPDHVVVNVLDRGVGLPEPSPSVVFDPFYTSKSPGKGIGLGLGLCWELARQNSGDLEALHREGGGAEFRLRLPNNSTLPS